MNNDELELHNAAVRLTASHTDMISLLFDGYLKSTDSYNSEAVSENINWIFNRAIELHDYYGYSEAVDKTIHHFLVASEILHDEYEKLEK